MPDPSPAPAAQWLGWLSATSECLVVLSSEITVHIGLQANVDGSGFVPVGCYLPLLIVALRLSKRGFPPPVRSA